MKARGNNFIRNFIVAGIFLAASGFFHAANAGVEEINNFNVKIIVENNGTVDVRETIVYDFGLNQKHGIFRDIPLTANNGPRLVIQVAEVADEAGRSYRYAVAEAGSVLDIKIGDPGALVSGVKTYVITYRVSNAIRNFSDHDELYWNATGDQWQVGIKTADVRVALPTSSIPGIRMDCFTGIRSSTEKNCAFNGGISSISYSTTKPLNVGEGFTIVLGIPVGYIDHASAVSIAPSRSDAESKTKFASGFLLLYGLPVLFGLILLARKNSGFSSWNKPSPIIPKELKGRPVVVEYNPPDNLPPIEIGTLLDRRVDVTDISSVVMDLAIRGYLKIRYTVEQIKFWPDKKDFEFIKLKDGADLVHPADKTMFSLLFTGSVVSMGSKVILVNRAAPEEAPETARDSVKLSDLRNLGSSFHKTVQQIKKDTEQRMHDEGYFDQAAEDKAKRFSAYLTAGFVVSFLGFFIIRAFRTNAWLASVFSLVTIIAFVLQFFLLVLTFVASRLFHKLTPQGVSALAKILGFMEFLQLTEKDRLDLLNAPELQPETFEKFLPYAMVLGVEDKWAKKFEGVYNASPAWYEDPTMRTFNSVVLLQNLSLFNSSFNQVFNITAPRSSSGFGGGSSGGGSGGGGGGSW